MSFLGNGTLAQFADPGDIAQGQPNSKFQKPNMPKPPDFKGLIDEQAKVNRINQQTPFGSLSFTTNGRGQTVAHYNLSPQYKGISNQLFGQIQNASQFNPANLKTSFNKGIANQYYNNAMKLLQPQMQQQQDAFTQNLADRGLPAGSQLAGSLSDQFNSGQNNLRLQTAQDAISQGLAYTQAQNQARQQQQQASQSYLQGIGGLYQQFTPGLNQFFAPGGIDVNGSQNLAQNAANQNYQSLMNAYSANQQGLYGLGSAGIAALFAKGASASSDRRLKKDITRIGQTHNGIPLYSFRYHNDPKYYIGPMADEVLKKQPEAVMMGDDGYYKVHYGMLS